MCLSCGTVTAITKTFSTVVDGERTSAQSFFVRSLSITDDLLCGSKPLLSARSRLHGEIATYALNGRYPPTSGDLTQFITQNRGKVVVQCFAKLGLEGRR
jgi:hypothetical protein